MTITIEKNGKEYVYTDISRVDEDAEFYEFIEDGVSHYHEKSEVDSICIS